MSAFRDLHVPGAPLIMPNPWDVGSARMMQAAGAQALASTSAGAAFAQGRRDGDLNLDEMLDAATALARATPLPVSADLENGGGDAPDYAAAATLRAAEAGLAGASIEDLGTAPDGDDPIYPFDLALARVEAAVAACDGTDLVLTARSEGLLTGTLSLDQVCTRITAFAQAGAHVVFAPGLKTPEAVAQVVAAARGTPVSMLLGSTLPELSVTRLAALGVARISFGSGLARAAYGTAVEVVRGALDAGEVRYPAQTASFQDISDWV